MEKGKKLPRRDFLRSTALGAVTATTAIKHLRAQEPMSMDRLNVGIIGCGSIAQSHLWALLGLRESDNVEILAVCDVYQTRARAFQDQIWKVGGNARAFWDYRKLLEMKELDYVLIATPEHWHCQQTLDALDAGFHIYCEKPITHTVNEAHQVLSKVRETGRLLQVGVQGMSDDSYQSANDAIREGLLGPVVAAQTDYVRNYSPEQGPWRTGVLDHLEKPDDLDWKSWLGPAPKQPWDPHRYFEWRNYRDYSGGIATDLFIHRLTRIMKACDLSYPTRVVGMGGIYIWPDGRDLPDNFEMTAEYPAVEGITPGMTVHVLGTMANGQSNPHMIRGQKASLIFNSDGWEIVAEERSSSVLRSHTRTGAESIPLHHRNLHAAIRSGEELLCPVELGVAGLTAVAGANQSWFDKKMLTWDSARLDWV